LLIQPVRAVIDLGAANDMLNAAFRAVHHANRHGAPDDFIAAALPLMRKGRERVLPGHDLELIGSPNSLRGLLNLEGMVILKRRGMLENIEISEVYHEPGMTGAAYIRVRSSQQGTAGWIRRSLARAERRGVPVGNPMRRVQPDETGLLVLRHGDAVLHIREKVAPYTGEKLMVSTYGFSAETAPAILPIHPEKPFDADDAA
jgi:hypothetical protein